MSRIHNKTALSHSRTKKPKRGSNLYKDKKGVIDVASTDKLCGNDDKVRHLNHIDISVKKKTNANTVKAECMDSDTENSDSSDDEFVADTRQVVDEVSFGLDSKMDKRRKEKRRVLSLGELVDARHKEELISSLLSADVGDSSVSQKQTTTHSDEQQSIKSDLERLSLEELQKLKEKIGLKLNDKVTSPVKKQRKETKFFQPVKKRPQEMSSKRRAPILRDAHIKKKVHRDPRFDDLSGVYNEEHFKTDYAFLDDIKQREKQMLKVALRREGNPERREKISSVLTRMHHQGLSEKEKHKQKLREEQWKLTESQRVQEGKTPYFLKKSDKRKLELADKFQELKQAGKLDDYLAKRRKKSVHKQRRKMPGERDKS